MQYFDQPQQAILRPVTLKSKAYEHIRQKLFDGRLREGAHLSPVELGKEIGVSHIPVREAITQLASEGLVIQVARQGAFVRQMQREELLELIEVRGMLEAATVTKVAKRIKPRELAELEEYLKGLEQLLEEFQAEDGSDTSEFEERMIDLMGQWMLADMSFHMLLLRIGGNRQVAKIIAERQIMQQMFRHRTDSPDAWKLPLSKYYEDNYLVHKAIYDAIAANDTKASRAAMNSHTKRARKNMLARFDWLRSQKNADTPMARDFPDSLQRLVQGVQSRFIKGGTQT